MDEHTIGRLGLRCATRPSSGQVGAIRSWLRVLLTQDAGPR
jgi:hypothetical protein